MAESEKVIEEPAKTEEPAAEVPKQEPKFTQEDLDRLIEDRLKRERTAREKEDAERKRQAEIEKLQGEDRLRAEHADAMAKLAAERDQAAERVRVLEAGEALAKMGYDTSLAESLLGKDAEATAAIIAAFDAAVKAGVEKRMAERIARGAPAAPTGAAVSSEYQIMRKAAGLR